MKLLLVNDQDDLGSFNKIKPLAKKYKTTLYVGMETTDEPPSLQKWESLFINLTTMGYTIRQKATQAIHPLNDILRLTMDIANTRLADEMHIVHDGDVTYLRVWAD